MNRSRLAQAKNRLEIAFNFFDFWQILVGRGTIEISISRIMDMVNRYLPYEQ